MPVARKPFRPYPFLPILILAIRIPIPGHILPHIFIVYRRVLRMNIIHRILDNNKQKAG
jgi:hypothetical protein